MDSRKEKALLDAIRTVSKYLGKEDEFQSFIAYTSFAEETARLDTDRLAAAHQAL